MNELLSELLSEIFSEGLSGLLSEDDSIVISPKLFAGYNETAVNYWTP